MGYTFEMPLLVSITIAILTLYLGIKFNNSIKVLHTWGVPNVVTGGILVAGINWLLFKFFNVNFVFDMSARDILLLYFFTSIGLNIRLSDVVRGGKGLCILIALTTGLILIQNVVSYFVVSVFSLPHELRVLLGSLSLIGGHGTAIAWAPIIDSHFGVHNSLEIGIAIATFGLIAGSIIGGPIAHLLITRFNLKSTSSAPSTIGIPDNIVNDGVNDLNHLTLLRTIAIIHIAILLAYCLDFIFVSLNIKMPLFISALIMAMLIANIVPVFIPKFSLPEKTRALALISDLSLEMFLSLSLIGMQFWQLADLGVPILFTFALHTALVMLYILFIVFPLMGKDYDAAVISAGFAGIGLGSTATAFANISTTTLMHGSSPKAFILMSLVSALFLDIANSVIISFLVR